MHGEGSMAKRRYGIRTNSLIGILFGIISGMLLASWSGYRFITCGLSHGRCCILGQLSNDPVKVMDTSQPYASTSCQQTVRKSTKNFILIGVMTAKKYLNTRAIAAYKTWARSINGEVIFFSSETSQGNGDIPVVGLRGVDDTYPPQKKSFSMLKYMHDHYIDEFEWFMRADDDVYIKGSRLQSFLRSINSSKPQFIGQAGLGTKEESGLLKLKENENFCMGGPGIVFSRATLKLVASHVDHCMQSPLTLHEDVEIGRCVQRYAGISCTWAFEVNISYLHVNYTLFLSLYVCVCIACYVNFFTVFLRGFSVQRGQDFFILFYLFSLNIKFISNVWNYFPKTLPLRRAGACGHTHTWITVCLCTAEGFCTVCVCIDR